MLFSPLRTKNGFVFLRAAIALLAALLSGCGGGGGGGDGGGTPPPTPTAVTPTTGNSQVAVSWTAVAGATSYNVYRSATSPVTAASNKTNVITTGSTLSGLANGTPVFIAVTAVNAAGESPLSSEVCAVPTGASITGLTLYDPLCAGALDAAKWRTPLFGREVANGAMLLSTRASNMEAFTSQGLAYSTSATVNTAARVTTLKADVIVPAAAASRTGGAEIRAALRLAYQPPANRLVFPAGSLDQLTIQVGLQDVGAGLRAFRSISHCDNPSCTSSSSTGIVFSDPVGFSGEAAASNDTTYTITVSLDEGSGVFTWSIAGGAFGAGISGTADPGDYLAGNASWASIPLAGSGFLGATLRTRLLDNAGGSSGSISARFDNVLVGLNGAVATLWDDFSATGANSGPTELSPGKWRGTPGRNSMALTAGSLVGHAQATKPSTDELAVFHSLDFSNPAAINTIQADITVSACSNSLSSTNRVGPAASIYNDGSQPLGATAPDINQPNSRVGDVIASLFLDCVAGVVRFQVTHFNTMGSQTILSSANSIVPKGPAPIIGNTHTLTMKWDPATRLLTFQADGETPVVVDPTTANTHMSTAAPYAKPPNAPQKNLGWFLFLPGGFPGGATANVDFRMNNVFTAP